MSKSRLFTATILASVALAVTIPAAWAAKDYLAEGKAALAKGDYKTAQIQLRNAARDKPDDAETRFLLSRVDLSMGDPVAGEKEARAARDLGYDEPKAIFLLGEAYLAQGKVDPLLKDFTPLGKDPKADAAIQVIRGYALLAQRKLPEAQAAVDAAEKGAPDMPEAKLAEARIALGKGDLDTADKQVTAALQLDPASSEAFLQRAQIQRLRQDPKGAVETLDALLKANPGAVGARLERATLLTALGQDDRAREDVAAVQAIVPNSVQAAYLQANLLTRQKDYAGADTILSRLGPALAGLPRGYLLQAGVKEALGQGEQARDAVTKYVARVPADVEGARMLARLELERRNPEPVVLALKPIKDSGHADAGALELLGRAYTLQNKGPEAADAFAAAIEKLPENAGLHAELGSLKAQMGDSVAAQIELSKALQLDKKNPAIAEQLYAAAVASGDLANADRAVAAVKAAQPDSPVSGNLEGLLEMQKLDYIQAKHSFEAVQAAHPDFAPAKINLARIAAMQGRLADETKILDGQLKSDPASEPALSMRLSDLSRAKQFDEAEATLRRAIGASKDKTLLTARLGSLFLLAGQPQKALDTVVPLKDAMKSDARVIAVAAQAYQANGQKQEVRDTLTRLVELEPRALQYRRQLAAQLMQAGDPEQARRVIEAGLALDPRNLTLLEDLVSIDYKTGGLDAALQTADRMREQNKDFPQIRTLKGDTLMVANKFDDAAAAYAEAQKVAPSAFFVTHEADALLRAGKRDDAVKRLREWMAAHPEDTQITERVSEFDIADKNLPDAQKLLEDVVQRAPRTPIALNNLAWVYQQVNDPRAEDTARRAFQLAPSGQTADTWGWILVKSGRATDAMGLMRQASAETQGDPRVQYHFAYALNEVGQKQDAIAVLKPLVEGDATFDEKPDATKLLQALNKGA